MGLNGESEAENETTENNNGPAEQTNGNCARGQANE